LLPRITAFESPVLSPIDGVTALTVGGRTKLNLAAGVFFVDPPGPDKTTSTVPEPGES
jgi:hypothetical protein